MEGVPTMRVASQNDNTKGDGSDANDEIQNEYLVPSNVFKCVRRQSPKCLRR